MFFLKRMAYMDRSCHFYSPRMMSTKFAELISRCGLSGKMLQKAGVGSNQDALSMIFGDDRREGNAFEAFQSLSAGEGFDCKSRARTEAG